MSNSERSIDKGMEVTRGSLLVKNTLWNTLGLVLPLVVGLFAMPFLIHGLGIERFGVLTIAWMVIGYFSVFDFGLGRALTKLVAEKLGGEDHSSIPSLIWTAMAMMGCAGVIGSIVVALLAEKMVYSWLNIEQALQSESLSAFYILAFSIPLVVITTGFRGVLEAYQKFAIVNIIRIPLGLLTFLGPLAVLSFSNSLDSIVLILLLGRLIGAYAYYHYCVKAVPEIKVKVEIDKAAVKPLLSFGGWMTVSNVLGPLMVYLDRFLIGAVLTMTAVSYYVAPYEMVTKLWMIPMGLIGVLFPAFSTLLSSDKDKAVKYYSRALNLIFFGMLPIFLVLNTFAYEGMGIWLGDDFASNSTGVLQWLTIGVFINCIGRIPFVFVQSAGRPDLPAKLFFIELPVYLVALWFALDEFGIEGAAMVWTARILVDTVAFLLIANNLIPQLSEQTFSVLWKLTVGTLVLITLVLINTLVIKVTVLVITLLLTIVVAVRWGLDPADIKKIKSFVK